MIRINWRQFFWDREWLGFQWIAGCSNHYYPKTSCKMCHSEGEWYNLWTHSDWKWNRVRGHLRIGLVDPEIERGEH